MNINAKNLLVERLHPSLTNPRKEFDDEALNELAETIRAHGILEPLVVRPQKDNRSEFEIIAGERRWRAAQLAGLSTVPCLVRDDLQDQQVLEIQFIENLQRADLKPIEEARGFKRLVVSDDEEVEPLYSVEELAAKLGKSRSYVFERLKLLESSAPVREALEEGKLAPRTALEIERAALEPNRKAQVVQEIVEKGLSTREATKVLHNLVEQADRVIADLESSPDGPQDEAEASRVAAANAGNFFEAAFGEAGPGMLGKGPAEQKPKPIDPLDYEAVLASNPQPGSAAFYHKQRIRQRFEHDFRQKLLVNITTFFSSGRGKHANVTELEKVGRALGAFMNVEAIRQAVIGAMEEEDREQVEKLVKVVEKELPKKKAKLPEVSVDWDLFKDHVQEPNEHGVFEDPERHKITVSGRKDLKVEIRIARGVKGWYSAYDVQGKDFGASSPTSIRGACFLTRQGAFVNAGVGAVDRLKPHEGSAAVLTALFHFFHNNFPPESAEPPKKPKPKAKVDPVRDLRSRAARQRELWAKNKKGSEPARANV